MARIRTLKPEAWQDKALGTCSRDARLLWVSLITFSDDEGRFVANPGAIFGHGYPHDYEAIPLIDGWLRELADASLIVLYTAGDEEFGFFPTWTAHQKVSHPTRSRLPEPDGEPRESLAKSPENLRSDSGAAETPEGTGIPEGSGKDPEPSGAAPPSTHDHRPTTTDLGPRTSSSGGGARAIDRLSLIDLEAATPPFAAAWPMEGGDVRRLLESEPESVVEQVVGRLLDEYRRWQAHGIRHYVEHKWLPAARRATAPPPAGSGVRRGSQGPWPAPSGQAVAVARDDAYEAAILAAADGGQG